MAVAEKVKAGATSELPRANATDSGVRLKPPTRQSAFFDMQPIEPDTIVGKVVNIATRVKARVRKSARNLARVFQNMDNLDKDLPHVPPEAILNEHCENGVMVISASSLGREKKEGIESA